MSSAPSVPGVEVGASWLGGCEHGLTFSDIIAARIQPAAVEMMDALALQAAEPPSAACRSEATSMTRWTGAGTPIWHSTRTAALSR
jgi:hypothetical protein